MKTNSKSVLALIAAFCLGPFAQAQTVVYDNLSTAPMVGFQDLNANNPIFGDSLNLTQGGRLSALGLTLFNPRLPDNTGSILTGTMFVNFYDNTVPYVSGVLNNPLLGTATVNWDFTPLGGLQPGQFSPNYYNLTSLNINLPQHILITQRFTETSGTSIRNGVAIYSNPTTGSSPNSFYVNSAANPEGLYTLAPYSGQFGYQIQVVPEPGTFALAGLGFIGMMVLRRRK